MRFRILIASALVCAGFAAAAVPARALVRDGTEFEVNSYTTGDQNDPAVAGLTENDSDNHFVIVWQSSEQDDDGTGIFGELYDEDDEATGEFEVNTYTTGNQQHVDVAPLRDGAFVVVWASEEQDGSRLGIFGKLFDEDALPDDDDDLLINTTTTGDQDFPAIGSHAVGFIVVWQSDDQDGSGLGIYGQRFDINGEKVGSEFLVNTTTSGNQRNAVVSAAPDTSFTVFWTNEASGTGGDGSGGSIFAQRYSPNGARNGTEFRVNSQTTSDQVRPAAVALGRGFVATWESRSIEESGNSDGVAGQKRGANAAPSTDFQVNSYTTSFQEDVAMAAAPAAEMVVVWESQGGEAGGVSPEETGDGVFGRALNPSGRPIGTEFQVNTTTTDAQQDPRVAALFDGRYVVAWEDVTQDGTGTNADSGISAQIYSADICGDATNDRAVTTADALKVLRSANGLINCRTCVCDADGDGAVDTADALVVLKASLRDFAALNCNAC